MKVLNDRMFDVAFQQMLQVARGGGEHRVESRQFVAAKVMQEKAGRVRALCRLMSA